MKTELLKPKFTVRDSDELELLQETLAYDIKGDVSEIFTVIDWLAVTGIDEEIECMLDSSKQMIIISASLNLISQFRMNAILPVIGVEFNEKTANIFIDISRHSKNNINTIALRLMTYLNRNNGNVNA